LAYLLDYQYRFNYELLKIRIEKKMALGCSLRPNPEISALKSFKDDVASVKFGYE
jgi:hypothetical protein